MLKQAHLTAADDWDEQHGLLSERFDAALDPLRESFDGLYDAAKSNSDDAQAVLRDELRRIDSALDALNHLDEGEM